jgi:hypothetical protein
MCSPVEVRKRFGVYVGHLFLAGYLLGLLLSSEDEGTAFL